MICKQFPTQVLQYIMHTSSSGCRNVDRNVGRGFQSTNKNVCFMLAAIFSIALYPNLANFSKECFLSFKNLSNFVLIALIVVQSSTIYTILACFDLCILDNATQSLVNYCTTGIGLPGKGHRYTILHSLKIHTIIRKNVHLKTGLCSTVLFIITLAHKYQ